MSPGESRQDRGQFSSWENKAEPRALTAQTPCSCPMTLMKRGQVRSESPLSPSRSLVTPLPATARGHCQFRWEWQKESTPSPSPPANLPPQPPEPLLLPPQPDPLPPAFSPALAAKPHPLQSFFFNFFYLIPFFFKCSFPPSLPALPQPPAPPPCRTAPCWGGRREGDESPQPLCFTPAQPAVAREPRSSATDPSRFTARPHDPLGPSWQPALGPSVGPRPPKTRGGAAAGAPGEGCGGSVLLPFLEGMGSERDSSVLPQTKGHSEAEPVPLTAAKIFL